MAPHTAWPALLLTAPLLFGLAAAYPHRGYHEETDGPAPEKNVRHIDGLGGGHLLRDTWGLEQLQRLAQQQQQQLPCRQRRGLDSLSGVTFGGARKRFNSLNGGTFGTNKRNFDEIDRTSFNSFTKRNFDEIDRAGFDSFVKRNQAGVQAGAPAGVPVALALPELDDLERPLYGMGMAARLHRLQDQEQQ